MIAFYRPVFPCKKYNIGEVHGELCFVANAGSGMVLHPVSFAFQSFVFLASLLTARIHSAVDGHGMLDRDA